MKTFINRDGGFSYWPGHEDWDSWGTTYAGHFLIEAEAKGYYVPNDMIKRWKKYQKNKAQGWRKNQEYSSSELIQAYRLYALALAGDPELGAMNRLREQGNMPATAAWMLAAAYVKAGQPEAGKKLIEKLPTTVKPYQEMAYSYGSDLRDKAIMLETLLLLNDRAQGFELVKEISESMSNSSYWMSTQTLAWCLKSVGVLGRQVPRRPGHRRPQACGHHGRSYGGYATLAGVAFTPDLYAAAVAIVAPSNLITLLDSIPPYWEAGRISFYERMGNPKTPEGKAQLERQSPLNSAQKIKTPLMVVQGANDPRVKKAESEQIVIALRDRGFPVEYLMAPDEGHGFQRPVNMALWAASEAFFPKHLGGRAQKEMSVSVPSKLPNKRIPSFT